MVHRMARGTLILLAVVTTACASMETSAPRGAPAFGAAVVDVEGVEGVERVLRRDGRVLIGGQPSAEALAALEARGVTAVVNARTPDEMEDHERVPYDEGQTVRELGMEYVHIPLGGADHPYTPEAVERLAEVLDRHPGPVFLHCGVAGRAAWLWTAYLVRFGGLDVEEAMEHGRAVALRPSPLEGLLGRPIRLAYGD
jgi:uncharacterized protein (TIGR01244 family)